MNVKHGMALAGLALLMLFGFQNCSEFSLDDDVVYQESLNSLAFELDIKYLKSLLNTSELAYWNRNGQGDTVGISPIYGTAASVIVAVNRTATGKIASFQSNALEEECSITITGGKIIGARYASNINYSTVEMDIPASGDRMVLAASCGEVGGELILMVNGIAATAAPVQAGVQIDFSYLMKQMIVGGPILEAMGYNLKLSKAQLNVMSRYVAANQQIPNVVLDPALLRDTAPGTTLPNTFAAAKAVIDSKCLSCHGASSTYGVFANINGASSYIVRGNPEASPLYYRLIGSTGANGPKNMPQGGSISAAEVAAVAAWISSL